MARSRLAEARRGGGTGGPRFWSEYAAIASGVGRNGGATERGGSAVTMCLARGSCELRLGFENRSRFARTALKSFSYLDLLNYLNSETRMING